MEGYRDEEKEEDEKMTLDDSMSVELEGLKAAASNSGGGRGS